MQEELDLQSIRNATLQFPSFYFNCSTEPSQHQAAHNTVLNAEMEDNITASTMLFSSFQINTSEMYIREEMVLLKRYNLNHFPHLVRQQIHVNGLKS